MFLLYLVARVLAVGGGGEEDGQGEGKSQESWEADPAGRQADGMAGVGGEATPLCPREHNAHAGAPDLSIVPVPPALRCQGQMKEAIYHGSLPGLAFTASRAVAGLALFLQTARPCSPPLLPQGPQRKSDVLSPHPGWEAVKTKRRQWAPGGHHAQASPAVPSGRTAGLELAFVREQPAALPGEGESPLSISRQRDGLGQCRPDARVLPASGRPAPMLEPPFPSPRVPLHGPEPSRAAGEPAGPGTAGK